MPSSSIEELRTGQSRNGVEVVVGALAENEGSGSVVARSVLDNVALAGLNLRRELVDLNGEGSSDEGRASEDALDEAHCG